MHRVKYKARSFARSNSDSSNFSLFRTTSSRSSVNRSERDIERGLAPPNATNEDALSAVDEREGSRKSHEAENFNSTTSSATLNPSLLHTSQQLEKSEEQRKPSAATGDTAVDTNDGVNGSSARRRKLNIFKKDSNDSSNEKRDNEYKEKKKTKWYKNNIPVWQQVKFILFENWLNVLLVACPIGIALKAADQNYIAVFVVNFIAIIPLAGLLSNSTEQLALYTGETLGGLLNASFGNAVELIVSIQALVKGEIVIVKTSLIGSILSNLLLVLGMAFFFGGINRVEQFFNVTVAQTAASLLGLAIGSLIIPTVFRDGTPIDSSQEGQLQDKVEAVSRGTAILLLIVYGCYLFFQLKSHKDMYNEPSQKGTSRKSKEISEAGAAKMVATAGVGQSASVGGQMFSAGRPEQQHGDDDDDEEEPQLSVIGALIFLAISTALVAVNSEFMVDGIDQITATGAISKTFVGLILIPIVGNAAEHATAVTVAIKDKMDLAIGVAVGSSMQIALLVLPLIDIIGWITQSQDCTGQEMSLSFDLFQLALIFVAVLLVNYLIQDGKSHWLEGVMLMSSYIIIAVAAWFYPTTEDCQT